MIQGKKVHPITTKPSVSGIGRTAVSMVYPHTMSQQQISTTEEEGYY
jgi:hypothetical protein